ncbi:hypothetical protein ACMHYO_14395 [Allopusillimonas ginsengisoli]|uniref:hypothetical protein n=1 Tax=Allopusillimonas ginsengisoli TaxID=453575 RepID=UPI0039C1CB86
MAINLDDRYPGRANGKTVSYPQGSFKNRTSPSSKDGTYLEQDWANDQLAFFQSLMSEAGLTANSTVDVVGASQYFDALTGVIESVSAGRLIGVQWFTSGATYTPSAGTKSIVVEVQAGGGAGGGALSAVGGCSAGGGGGGGSYGRARFTSGFSGAAITVGAGGSGVLGASGGAGGSSSFGGLLSCGAGQGGGAGPIQTAATVGGVPGGGQAVSGATLVVIGGPGSVGLNLSATSGRGGYGGKSFYGTGGNGTGDNATAVSAGGNGIGYGSGGGGAIGINNGTLGKGGDGAPGVVIVWEYA